MSLKFSCNVSTLFTEYSFLERFKHAKDFGFTHFEMHSPYEYEPKDFNLCGLKCDLLNTYCDKQSSGYASVPCMAGEFCQSLTAAAAYFPVLNFKKLHILAGDRVDSAAPEEQFNAFVNRLDSATEFLEEYTLVGLIEPICKDVKENYYLSSYDMAIKILEATENKNVKLLLDVYHLHKITGDVKTNLEKYYPYAGHIQISQDPGRFEPFYPGGQIDYDFVFEFLKDKGHQDYIGLEYIPHTESTVDSLNWLKKYL